MSKNKRFMWVHVVVWLFSVVWLCACTSSKSQNSEQVTRKIVAKKRGQDSVSTNLEKPKDSSSQINKSEIKWTTDAGSKVSFKLLNSSEAAMKEILLETDPLVIGFGEFHQTEGTTKIESAIARFTKAIVPVLVEKTSNLVVETWVNLGSCGKAEEAVHKDVKKTTERPETTETEVVKLIKRVQKAGLGAHILEFDCKDYEKLLENDNKVDYFELLGLITRGLSNKTQDILKNPPKNPSIKEGESTGEKTVVIYGGAIHNDINPYQDLEKYTYAMDLQKASGNRYLEVDLYVPEFVETNEPLKQEPWFALFKRLSSKDKVLLIKRDKNSYILVFKRDIEAGKTPL